MSDGVDPMAGSMMATGLSATDVGMAPLVGRGVDTTAGAVGGGGVDPAAAAKMGIGVYRDEVTMMDDTGGATNLGAGPVGPRMMGTGSFGYDEYGNPVMRAF